MWIGTMPAPAVDWHTICAQDVTTVSAVGSECAASDVGATHPVTTYCCFPRVYEHSGMVRTNLVVN